ncbi:hypothetical protein P3S68_014884 [Capsicum galapagoense]
MILNRLKMHYKDPSFMTIHLGSNTLSRDLLKMLNISSDDKILPTTYGELRPPLGKHCLKIVEFNSVLLNTGNKVAKDELSSSGIIERILDLFFEF